MAGVRLEFKGLLSDSICILGSGFSVYFWLDNWLGYHLVDKLGIDQSYHNFLRDRVSSFRVNGQCALSSVYPEVAEDIVVGLDKDERLWKGSINSWQC